MSVLPDKGRSLYQTMDNIFVSNNVRVNLKKTDFQASSIGLTARFGTGMLSQDGSKPGVQYFASQVMNGGGLGKHSNDDLSRILAGKNVGASFSVGEGSFALSGGTTPEDLKLQLRNRLGTDSSPMLTQQACRDDLYLRTGCLGRSLKSAGIGGLRPQLPGFRVSQTLQLE